MHPDLSRSKHLLETRSLALAAVRQGKVIYESSEPGIRALLSALTADRNLLNDSHIADRVIGKAAALLFILAGVSDVYSPVVSRCALEALDKSRVKVFFDRKVEHIISRTGEGICPMEFACLYVEDPEQAFKILSEKVFGGSVL